MAFSFIERQRGADVNGPLEIWKFGGASLADEHGIQRAALQIAAHLRQGSGGQAQGGPLVVVVSALAGTTDLLLNGAQRAASGDYRSASAAASAFRAKHTRAARAVAKGRARERLLAAIDDAAREYAEVCKGLSLLGHLPPLAQDLLVSRGERLSAALLGAAVRGAVVVDALDVIATDGAHGNAAPDIAVTKQRARHHLAPIVRRSRVAVVPGFIGRAPDGSLTTLGRGGTDLTATLLARSLNASSVVFWKDVPGILTADPRMVADARVIPHLHHREAAEVAHYGAKVLHPRALDPGVGNTHQVADSILCRYRPARHGGLGARFAQGLSGQGDRDAVVAVRGHGRGQGHGRRSRHRGAHLRAVDEAGVSVSTIFQASSESSIGFTVPKPKRMPRSRRCGKPFATSSSTG